MWRVVAAGVLLIGLAAVGFSFPDYWPVPVIAGVLLIIVAVVSRTKPQLLPPSSNAEGHQAMQLPDIWDEREIGVGLERYRTDKSLLGRYVEGITSRFIMGQDTRTMEVRSQFLQTFNKNAEIARESYKWQRYLQGGRAALEEEYEDLQAKIKVQQAKDELEGIKADPALAELRKKAERVKLQLEIARDEKAIADMNRPDPPAPAPPPTAAEIRAQKKASLADREKKVREEMRLTEADALLSEEQRQRKLNTLDEKLATIHEEQTGLL